jgi:calpain-7
MSSSLRSIEARAENFEQSIETRNTPQAALQATIESAELYMKALKLTDSPVDRNRLNAKCKQLLSRAEHLKSQTDIRSHGHDEIPLLKSPVSLRKLTTRENIILLEGSRLNGFIFRPWDKEPSIDEFRLEPGSELFSDTPELPLSAVQLESFDGWKRPTEALSSVRFPGSDTQNEITMSTRGLSSVDLVQDLTSDCSVVASLCAGSSRAGRGHQKVRKSPWHLS